MMNFKNIEFNFRSDVQLFSQITVKFKQSLYILQSICELKKICLTYITVKKQFNSLTK